MTYERMKTLFEDASDEYIKFDRVQNKRSNRPDLHAFLLLDSLIPGDSDIISGSEHDEYYLEINPEKLAELATEEQIIELIRCGVRFDTNYDCLAMFS